MQEIISSLFVGSQYDYEEGIWPADEWAIVQACKEPFHRRALGYSGRAAPKSQPEYLIALRDNRLILNLVDANSRDYIPAEILNRAVAFVHEKLEAQKKVLIHCNQGRSRAPGIAMLYLGTHTECLPRDSFDAALADFRNIYPGFEPARGIHDFLQHAWTAFFQSKSP